MPKEGGRCGSLVQLGRGAPNTNRLPREDTPSPLTREKYVLNGACGRVLRTASTYLAQAQCGSVPGTAHHHNYREILKKTYSPSPGGRSQTLQRQGPEVQCRGAEGTGKAEDIKDPCLRRRHRGKEKSPETEFVQSGTPTSAWPRGFPHTVSAVWARAGL